VFSVHGDRRHVRATMRAGASGYPIKDDDAAKLADAIRTVHNGCLALTAELMSIINDDPPELSPQELQALYLYGTGSTLAAADEPVQDVRSLIHEYRPQGKSTR
jgi:DNA-binding NarL/FixJ family response regulator